MIAGALAFAALFSIISLNQSRETEKKIRLEKESELSVKSAELAAKEALRAILIKEKASLQEALDSQSSQLKELNATVQSQSEQLGALTQENGALKIALTDKDKKILALDKKIERLALDRSELLMKIKASGGSKGETNEKEEDFAADQMELNSGFETGSVDLGNIVIRQPSGNTATVTHVDEIYGFVVLSAGSKDGLKKDSVINIIRDDRFVGKAVLEKVRDNVSAAVILPQWTKRRIKEGDVITKEGAARKTAEPSPRPQLLKSKRADIAPLISSYHDQPKPAKQ